MNKLFTSIAVASLSLTMAVGVGVAVSQSAKQEATQVNADVTYTKIAFYNFDDGTAASTTKYNEAGLKARFANAADTSTSGLSDIVTSVNTATNIYPGTTNYTSLGIKFGTSSANGVFTVSLSETVDKVVVVAAGWGTSDTIKVGDAAAQTPGVAYTADNPLKTLTYTISSTSTPTFTFAKRGFIQSIEFYQAEASGDIPVDGVSLDKEYAYTTVGGSNITLTATVSPALATDKSVSWSSSATGVATVTDGIVTPVTAGTTTITVTTTDGSFTDSCSILVLSSTAGKSDNDPLTIAQAIAISKSLASGATTPIQYYISGEVSSINSPYSSEHGNISLDFASGSETFIGYRLLVEQSYGESIAVGDTILFQGTITNYNGTFETSAGGSIITGTTYPEPALVVGTLAQLFANGDGNHKQRYQVTGVLAAWYGTNTDGTKYGNFYLTDIGETTQYYIYGATATASALAWNENTGVYTFTNPQDFLTDTLTKDVALTYQVTMILTRCDHTSSGVTTPEACGIVTAVTPMPTISIDQEDTTIYMSGTTSATLTATTTNDGGNPVVWSSSDDSIAEIGSSTGVVSAVSVGSVTITATLTVSGNDYTDSITVTVAQGATGPLKDGGRYYIIATKNNVEYGLSAIASTSALPTAVALNSTNSLIAFDVTLTANNSYEITTTINNIKYYLVNNSTATSSNNDKIRVTNNPTNVASKSWELIALTGSDAGLYNVRENTVGSTYRYLSLYNTQDWRGYLNTGSGVPKIKFVEEKSYAEGVADKILESCTSRGSSSYDTTAWGNASTAYAAITIEAEKNFLINGSAVKDSTVKLERALEQYDYAVSRYEGIDAFITGRTGIYGLANNASLFAGISTEATTAIIVVVALTSVTSIGAIFFIKRRKYN